MFISKMNRFLDRHGRVAMIIIGVLVVIPFLFFWGPSTSLFDKVRGGGGKIGSMYGEPITANDLKKQVVGVRLNMFMQYGQWLPSNSQMNSMLMQQAMRRMRVLHVAKKRGLDDVSQAKVEDRIREMFSRKGQFDSKRYKQFVDGILAKQGLKENDLVKLVRDSMIVDRVTEQVRDAVFVSPLEVKQQVKRDYETFQVFLHSYNADDYLDDADLGDDADLEEFYKQKVAKFKPFVDQGMSPQQIVEQARQGMLQISGKEGFEELSNTEIARLAEKYLAKYYVAPKKRVLVVEFPYSDYLEEVEQPDEKAIQSYYEEHQEEYKADTADTEDAESGDDIKPLDEVRSDVVAALKREQAEDLAFDAADQFSYDAFTADSEKEDTEPNEIVEEMAEEKGFEWSYSEPFAKNEKASIFNNDKSAAERAYKVSPATPISNVIKGDGTCYVVCWHEKIEGHIPEFSNDKDLQAKLREQMRMQRAVELARESAQEVYNNVEGQLEKGNDFQKLADALQFEEIPEFSRNDPPEEYEEQLLSNVAEHSAETLLEPIEINNGALVIYLAGRSLPSEKVVEEKMDEVRMKLKRRKQQAAMQRFYQRVREESETRLEEDLAKQIM